MMVLETSLYAQFIADNVGSLKPHSMIHKWKDSDELHVLLGLVDYSFIMGLLYKPRLSMYWSVDELFHTPLFSSVMAPDRFFILIRFLHFADKK